MAFQNENIAVGLQSSNNWQEGRANVDTNQNIEQGIGLPWSSDPAGSYMYFDCTVGVMLDDGIVVHNRLPQSSKQLSPGLGGGLAADTLAVTNLDDPSYDQIMQFGVNLKSIDQYNDIVQRMGHSRYWFRIWGQALRVGYRVPIPGIKVIGGVPAIPYDKNPQWAFNRIAPGGNYGGVILWHAAWSLWYTTAVPPASNNIPEADPSAHITGNVPPPQVQQAPYGQADSNAQPNSPIQNIIRTQ